MDVILTFRFKITYVLYPTLQMRTCIGVLKSIVIFLSFIHCQGICVYIVVFAVNSSIIATGDHPAGGSFMEKQKGLN